MGGEFMKSTSNLAVAVAAGLFFAVAPMGVASAADLGGNCCADLEERVAELEATTVRKGNRKVSLKLFGFVHRAIMVWDANDNGVSDNDIYSVGGGTTSGSRFGMKGSAKIGGGWSAGFMLEYGAPDTMAQHVSQNNSTGRDKASPELRHDVLYLKNKQIGTFYLGHTSTSTDGISEINLSGTKVATKGSAVQTWNKSFTVNGAGGGNWGNYVGNLDGARHDIIRYDTPTFAGFTASASYGRDDFYDVALRYANEFGGVLRVAAGIGYSVLSDENAPAGDQTVLNGSVSAMHVPTGLNVSFATGQKEDDAFAGTKNKYWHVTAGIKQKFTSVGATALYGEYGSYDMRNLVGAATVGRGDEASMWGLGVVQKIDAAAMEIYAAYRTYDLDTVADNSFSSINVGARIKF